MRVFCLKLITSVAVCALHRHSERMSEPKQKTGKSNKLHTSMRRQSDDDDLSRVIAGAIGFYCRGESSGMREAARNRFRQLRNLRFRNLWHLFRKVFRVKVRTHTHPLKVENPRKLVLTGGLCALCAGNFYAIISIPSRFYCFRFEKLVLRG